MEAAGFIPQARYYPPPPNIRFNARAHARTQGRPQALPPPERDDALFLGRRARASTGDPALRRLRVLHPLAGGVLPALRLGAAEPERGERAGHRAHVYDR